MRPSMALRRHEAPGSLARAFALRSAVVFLVVGVALHFVVQNLVEGNFRDSAEFHAVFVVDSVVRPQLDMWEDGGRGSLDYATMALRRYALDDFVYRIVLWRADGSVFLADSPVDTTAVDDDIAVLLHRARGEGTYSLEDPASYLDALPASSLRTFVPLADADGLVAEIHQDWSPMLAESRRFSRILEASLASGLVLLWLVLLPIARRTGRKLHEQARTDDLTSLSNRSALEEQLGAALERLDRRGGCVVLLFVDLDGFKTVNDTMGHEVGDQVLREVARRLRGRVAPYDVVARFAGDEFVVILEGIEEVFAEQVAGRLLEAVRQPFDGLVGVELSASIGMAMTQSASVDPDTLLRQADAAMYHAKAGGGDDWRVFDDALRDQVARRNWIERELRRGAQDQIDLVYQPFLTVADADGGEMVAVEGLMRWDHPVEGAISPAEFIPVAERNGTIERLGRRALEIGCCHLASWQRLLGDDRPFTLYLNLSAVQLNRRFLAEVDRCLAQSGADPHRLGFEITETAVLRDEAETFAVLDALRERGCRIALDDFGTGYSSLSRIRTLPLDLLKLDSSFVQELGESPRERAVVTAAARLARDLDILVLAEGIETEGQLQAVRQLGFDLAQGYHLARPAPADTVTGMLAAAVVTAAAYDEQR